jgi:hypothetical protein
MGTRQRLPVDGRHRRLHLEGNLAETIIPSFPGGSLGSLLLHGFASQPLFFREL